MSRPPARVFTLVELLVVIAIISILAGMLMPALQRARDAAHKADCMSKLKTLGQMVLFYVGDYEDVLPPNTKPGGGQWNYGGNPTNATPVPVGALAPYYGTAAYYYIGKAGETLCPSDPRQYAGSVYSAGDAGYFHNKSFSYGLNYSIISEYVSASASTTYRRITKHRRTKVMGMDNAGNGWDGTKCVYNQHQFNVDKRYSGQVPYHGNGSNKLWTDAHVDWSNKEMQNPTTVSPYLSEAYMLFKSDE